MHPAYSVIPFERLADGWLAVVQHLSRVGALPAALSLDTLTTWVREIYLREGLSARTKAQLGEVYRTNSSALAKEWYAAEAAGPPHPLAQVISRIKALYEMDYYLLSEVRTWIVPPLSTYGKQ